MCCSFELESLTGSRRIAKTTLCDKTYESYTQIIRLYLVPDLGKIQLSKLTAQDGQRFLNQRMASGLSSRTVRYSHATLRRALNQAVKWELIPRNVATLVEIPRRERKEQAFLTPDEARKFLETVRGDRLEAL